MYYYRNPGPIANPAHDGRFFPLLWGAPLLGGFVGGLIGGGIGGGLGSAFARPRPYYPPPAPYYYPPGRPPAPYGYGGPYGYY